MDDTTATVRAEWLEAEKDKIDAEIDRLLDWKNHYQMLAEIETLDSVAEIWTRNINLIDRQIDQLLTKKDNLSLSVPASWMEEGTHPSPIISGGEVLDTNETRGGDDIPF